jgi:peptidoglycan/xylan/chitin deacetylase (PgdA/CDA1 family)
LFTSASTQPLAKRVGKRVYHGLLASLSRREVAIPRAHAPLISFTFDDFPRSALTSGGAILEAHGVRGTYYAAPGLMGTTNELGSHYTADDVRDLLGRGHELGSHTFSHVSARALPTPAYADEITRGMRQGAAGTSGNFSYPYGEVTFAAKRAAGQLCTSCRGTQPGANGPTADLNLLRANALYSLTTPLPTIRALIARHASPGKWLIFYTHDVQHTPSPYGCTPDYLDAVVTQAIASRARIVTVADALSLL